MGIRWKYIKFKILLLYTNRGKRGEGMENVKKFYLEEIFEENRSRFHYHLYRLRNYDTYVNKGIENTLALQPEQGVLSTYFNIIIRKHIFELLQLKSINQHKIKLLPVASIEPNSPVTYPDNSASLWEYYENNLTVNQWKWVYLSLYLNLPIKEIAEQEGVTIEAVMNWGRDFNISLQRIIDGEA